MISKPKLTVDKFSGMNDKGGMFYIDGFSVENENGVQSMDENFRFTELVNNSTTNFSDINSIKAKTYLYSLPSSTLSAVNGYTLMMNDNSRFFVYDQFGFSNYRGEVGGVASSGTYLYSQKPDLFQLPSGNVIFTSSRHLGLIVRGTCHSSSSTTTIVDKAGRDFTTLGVSTSTPNNIVTNLKTGKKYTITAIGNQNATNDKLTFTAIDSSPNNENDEFMVFVHTYRDFNYVNGVSGTAVTIPTFIGQQNQVYWARQIQQYGNQYMILNGNYLALLANDESTVDSTYKQLPVGYQALTFSVNSVDNILVSAYDSKGKGALLLWDGSSDGWNKITPLETAPTALEPNGSGWVYLLDGTVYFTNGYEINPLITSPEKYQGYNTTAFNAIVTLNGVFYFGVSGAGYDRNSRGILVFDPNYGLSFFKCKSNGRAGVIPYCLSVKTGTRLDSQYSPNPTIEVAGALFYGQVTLYRPSTDTKEYKSFVMLLDFKQETQVSEIWLNVKRGTKCYRTDRANNATISVNYGDNKTPILSYGQGTVTGTTTVTSNGTLFPGVVGQEIEFTGTQLSAVSGQRTFIQSIANAGSSTETWTVSPALSETASATDLRAWGLKNAETKSITLSDLSKPLRFPVNFIGDKMWLEVTLRGTADSFPVSINSIQLF